MPLARAGMDFKEMFSLLQHVISCCCYSDLKEEKDVWERCPTHTKYYVKLTIMKPWKCANPHICFESIYSTLHFNKLTQNHYLYHFMYSSAPLSQLISVLLKLIICIWGQNSVNVVSSRSSNSCDKNCLEFHLLLTLFEQVTQWWYHKEFLMLGDR